MIKNKELAFMPYCIESYKFIKNLKTCEVLILFKKYNVLEYIKECYPILHTESQENIVLDIQEYIERNRK